MKPKLGDLYITKSDFCDYNVFRFVISVTANNVTYYRVYNGVQDICATKYNINWFIANVVKKDIRNETKVR